MLKRKNSCIIPLFSHIFLNMSHGALSEITSKKERSRYSENRFKQTQIRPKSDPNQTHSYPKPYYSLNSMKGW